MIVQELEKEVRFLFLVSDDVARELRVDVESFLTGDLVDSISVFGALVYELGNFEDHIPGGFAQ